MGAPGEAGVAGQQFTQDGDNNTSEVVVGVQEGVPVVSSDLELPPGNTIDASRAAF